MLAERNLLSFVTQCHLGILLDRGLNTNLMESFQSLHLIRRKISNMRDYFKLVGCAPDKESCSGWNLINCTRSCRMRYYHYNFALILYLALFVVEIQVVCTMLLSINSSILLSWCRHIPKLRYRKWCCSQLPGVRQCSVLTCKNSPWFIIRREKKRASGEIIQACTSRV